MFGAFGYLACAVQWLWGVILYSNSLQSYLTSVTPKVEKPIVHYSTNAVDANTSLLFLVLGSIVTVVIIGLSIYFVVKTPSAIVKTATKVVHETAETIAPVVLRIEHKSETPKNHRKVVLNIRLFLKIILILIPFVASVLSIKNNVPVFGYELVVYSSVALLSLTVVLFATQYLLGAIFKVNKKELW